MVSFFFKLHSIHNKRETTRISFVQNGNGVAEYSIVSIDVFPSDFRRERVSLDPVTRAVDVRVVSDKPSTR